MAGHDDSSVSQKKSSESEVPTFNAENLQSNMKVVYYRSVFKIWLQIHNFLKCRNVVIPDFLPLIIVLLSCDIASRTRTFMSIIGGVIAGILGFTGLMGFVIYLLVMGITSICLTAKTGFSVHSYFDSWNRVLLDGFLGGLLSFVLFWTFAYDIVHIF